MGIRGSIPENPAPMIRSRDDAHAAGLTRYYTGIPCKNKHLAERFVANTGCVACATRRRRQLAPEQTLVSLEVVINRPLTGERLYELKNLLYSWSAHVLKEWDAEDAK